MLSRMVPGAGLLIAVVGVAILSSEAGESSASWKAGTAAVVITPEESMWMAGYAARDKSSEGKVHDLNAKALVLEDSEGTRLAIVTLDLISIPVRLCVCQRRYAVNCPKPLPRVLRAAFDTETLGRLMLTSVVVSTLLNHG